MRVCTWVLALGLGLALAAPASAQNIFVFGQNNNRSIVNQPIDTSQSLVPIAQPQFFNVSQRISSFFHTFAPFSAKSPQGYSIFPSPSQMPGPGYLKAFGMNTNFRPPSK
jgi:hypothetical protein